MVCTQCEGRAARAYRDPLRCNPSWTLGLDPCNVQTFDLSIPHDSYDFPWRADDEWTPTAWQGGCRQSRAEEEWGRPHTLNTRTGQLGVYYPHGNIFTHGWIRVAPRPGKPGDSRYAYMTPTSESRLGALRRLRSSPSQTN